MEQKDFYETLAEELVDNNFDVVGTRDRHRVGDDSEAMDNVQPRSGVGVHLTPTKKKRRTSKGEVQSGLRQGRCMICRRKSTLTCSQCKDVDPEGPEPWLCTTRIGRTCFPTHFALKHSS
jgi:hypothetical protein